jgi:glucoside 3-dehydrogenase (cytochrome c) hitch-hiker subunit
MQRRQFLGLTALALGGMVHTRALGALIKSEEKALFFRPDYTARSANAFTVPQRQMVSAIAETIIPKTQTPGALEAGVPKFLELIVSDWMTEAERDKFLLGIVEVEQAAHKAHKVNFADCSPEQQHQLLDAIEDKHEDHPWYEQDGQSAFETEAPFIVVVKELTIFGFFMSKVGSTQVLRKNQMGAFHGDIPLNQEESSWSSVPLL